LIERRGSTESATWFRFPGGYIELLAIWRAIRVARLYRTFSPTLLKYCSAAIHHRWIKSGHDAHRYVLARAQSVRGIFLGD
jgi:hypothetical protein